MTHLSGHGRRSTETDVITPSPGVLLAPLGDGAVACDVASDQAHLLDQTSAWILETVTESAVSVDQLCDAAAGESGITRSEAGHLIGTRVRTLVELGLLGRDQPVTRPGPLRGSTAPPGDRSVGVTHAVIDHGVAFRSSDPSLLAEVDDFLGPAVDSRAADLYFDVERHGNGGITLDTDDQWIFPSRSAFQAQLPGVLNEYAARTHGCITVHSGAVRTPDGRVLLLPGHIDAGKSTVVAAMVLDGCDYLGDESIGIDTTDLHLLGYPKPMTLDSTSRDVLGLERSDSPHLSVTEMRADTVRVAGSDLRPDLIILPEYHGPRPTEPAPDHRPGEIRRLTTSEAIKALLSNTLNLERAGEAGLTALCRLAESVPVITVSHHDSVTLAQQIARGTLDIPSP